MPDIKSILDGSQAPKEVKADAWDLYQGVQTQDDFRAAFDAFPMDNETKAALWDLKFAAPTPSQAITGPTKEILGGIPGFAADISLPTIGAAAGGIVGSGIGPGGTAGGAAIGSASGEALSQFLKRKGLITVGRPPAETDAELAMEVGLAGMGGPLQEVAKIAGKAGKLPSVASKKTTEAAELGLEFQVPMTTAQRRGGALREYEALLRRSFLASTPFRKFDLMVNKRLIQAADEIGETMASGQVKRGPMEAGEFIQSKIKEVYDAAGPAYREILEAKVMPEAGKAPLDVTGNLRTAARDLLGDLSRPTEFAESTRSIDAVQKAMGILSDFANPTELVKSGVINPKTGKEIIHEQAKKLTFQQAHLLRSLLFDLSQSGEMVIGKGKIAQLNKALHASMMDAATKHASPEVAQTFARASGRFRQTMDLFEGTLLKSLTKRKNYEGVLDMLLSPKSSGSVMAAAMKALENKPAELDGIRRALWDRVIELTSKNKVFVGDVLETYLEKLGPSTTAKVFGAKAAKVERFAKLLDTVALDPRLTKPFSSSSLLAMGQGSAMMNPANLARTGPGALATLAGSLLGLGPVGARIMTRKSVTQAFLEGAQKPVIGLQAANRVIGAITRELGQRKMREMRRGIGQPEAVEPREVVYPYP